MNKDIFDSFIESISQYKYTSMLYVDYEDIKGYEVVKNNKDIILIYGYNDEAKMNEYHFATNEISNLINTINFHKNLLITFIPKEWINDLQEAGLKVYAKWNDYFKSNLEDVDRNINCEIAKITDSEEISEVTLSCRFQSRGFSGQTKDWVEKWISCAENETGTKDNAIIIERNDKGQIIGVVCTAIYSHESEKGPIVWIREVAVNPEYQRKGIARKLINEALSYGKSKGGKRAFLAADECNEYAIHLYESLGFVADKSNVQIDMFRE